MENKTKKTRTEQILIVMNILAWVAFVGYMIEAGAILVSFAINCINPDATKNLYRGLDLSGLRDFDFWHYTLSVSFMIAIPMLKAFVWYLVVKNLSRISLTDPFKMEVALALERIASVLFVTWLVELVRDGHMAWLKNLTGELYGVYDSGEVIFMAGLVFIISQVFKRGVEIQSENDLTV